MCFKIVVTRWYVKNKQKTLRTGTCVEKVWQLEFGVNNGAPQFAVCDCLGNVSCLGSRVVEYSYK